jgi:hypothetical protein
VHRPGAGRATVGTGESGFTMRMEPVRRWAADWADILVLAAFGCAIFLALGTFMPDWFARTSWSSGNQNRGTTIIDSPASYVGLMSLCGLVAFVALAVALWRRLAVAAALVAVAAFGLTAYVSGIYVWARMQGQVWGYAGWSISEGMVGRNETVYPAWGPPFFTLAALFGAVATLALAVSWLLSNSSETKTSLRTST